MKQAFFLLFAVFFSQGTWADFDSLPESNEQYQAFKRSMFQDFERLQNSTEDDTENVFKSLVAKMCGGTPTRQATKEDYALGYALAEALAMYCTTQGKQIHSFFLGLNTVNAQVISSWTQQGQNSSSNTLKQTLFGRTMYAFKDQFIRG